MYYIVGAYQKVLHHIDVRVMYTIGDYVMGNSTESDYTQNVWGVRVTINDEYHYYPLPRSVTLLMVIYHPTVMYYIVSVYENVLPHIDVRVKLTISDYVLGLGCKGHN